MESYLCSNMPMVFFVLVWAGELAILAALAFLAFRFWPRAQQKDPGDLVGEDPDVIDVDYYRSLVKR